VSGDVAAVVESPVNHVDAVTENVVPVKVDVVGADEPHKSVKCGPVVVSESGWLWSSVAD